VAYRGFHRHVNCVGGGGCVHREDCERWMKMLEEYIFVNENFEKIAEYQLADDDVAINQAERLCKDGMHVTCYRYVTDIFVPEKPKNCRCYIGDLSKVPYRYGIHVKGVK